MKAKKTNNFALFCLKQTPLSSVSPGVLFHCSYRGFLVTWLFHQSIDCSIVQLKKTTISSFVGIPVYFNKNIFYKNNWDEKKPKGQEFSEKENHACFIPCYSIYSHFVMIIRLEYFPYILLYYKYAYIMIYIGK